MVFYLKSVSHEEVKIPIGRGRELSLDSFQAYGKKNKKLFIRQHQYLQTTLLSLNNCKVCAKMKTQGSSIIQPRCVSPSTYFILMIINV